tara:strand:- start:68 stop:241 length:174 start_codon:yes stop_codon:yes gene_type:complete
MAFLIEDVKEIIMGLRSGEDYHKDRIEYHNQRLKSLQKDINMYQGKLNKAIGRRQNL